MDSEILGKEKSCCSYLCLRFCELKKVENVYVVNVREI